MAKLNVGLVSTDVLGAYSVVDIIVNDTLLVENLQLSADVQTYKFDFVFLEENTLTLSLVNDQAYDAEGDGIFEETLVASLVSLTYSLDSTTHTTLLPQDELSLFVTEGIHQGETVILNPQIDSFDSYDANSYSLKFDNRGLLNTPGLTGYFAREIDGVYYDSEGRVIPN